MCVSMLCKVQATRTAAAGARARDGGAQPPEHIDDTAHFTYLETT